MADCHLDTIDVLDRILTLELVRVTEAGCCFRSAFTWPRR